jgi:sulfite reductase (ferredoxin)
VPGVSVSADGSAGSIRGTSKFEQLKAGSGHLREPLLTELANEQPNFTEGAVQILKFHGSYQQDNRDHRQKGREKDWQMMLRLRSPGGRVPADLYLALDELADQLGNGTLRTTTRQAFQLHWSWRRSCRPITTAITSAAPPACWRDGRPLR